MTACVGLPLYLYLYPGTSAGRQVRHDTVDPRTLGVSHCRLLLCFLQLSKRAYCEDTTFFLTFDISDQAIRRPTQKVDPGSKDCVAQTKGPGILSATTHPFLAFCKQQYNRTIIIGPSLLPVCIDSHEHQVAAQGSNKGDTVLIIVWCG